LIVDFEKSVVEIPCPGCEFPNAATLHESRFGLTIPCRGCKRRIRIVPTDAGVMKATRLLEQFLGDLPRITTIKINL
jgi:hypothetical protein